jgi:peroxiredoxin
VSELPVTFVVDRQGVVRYVLGPDHDEHVLDRVLDSLD